MANSGWEKFLKFINNKELGHVITRTELNLWANVNDLSTNTMDMYRNKLVHAKIWKRTNRGTYEFQSKLPANTTTTELELLYKGDKLRYLENVASRKERNQRLLEKKQREDALSETNSRIIADMRSRPCSDCKGSFPSIVMTLSYRQTPSRHRVLSRMILGDTHRLVDELQKTDTVCRNCHIIRQGPGMLS